MLPQSSVIETVKRTFDEGIIHFRQDPKSWSCESTLQNINSHPCKSMKWHSKLAFRHSFVCNRKFYVDLALFAGKWIRHKWILQPIVDGWLKIFKLLKGHKIACDGTPWNWMMIPGFALFGVILLFLIFLIVVKGGSLFNDRRKCFMKEKHFLESIIFLKMFSDQKLSTWIR